MNQITFARLANFSSAVPWGLWVAVYVWLVGISAGCAALVCLGNLKNNPHLKKLTRPGLLLSLSALLAGLLSIQIDLGHMERFYKLFISPSPASVMAWMVWLYTGYFAVLAVTAIVSKKGAPRPLWQFLLLFSLVLIVVESLLFALPPGKQWHSVVFCAHFFTTSLVAAVSGLIVATALSWNKNDKADLLSGLGKIALPIIIINFGVKILETLIHGNLGETVTIGLILGNVAAIALLLKNTTKSITAAGAMGLIGILVSKYDSIVSSQLVEPFRGFGRAYVEAKLRYAYSPTAFEWLAGISLALLAAALFYFLYKVLPLTREE